MTANQLHDLIIYKIKAINPEFEFTAMQDAILEEMCDRVIQSGTIDQSNEYEIISISLNSMEAAYNFMKSLIINLLGKTDIINIDYRGKSFSFDKNTKQI